MADEMKIKEELVFNKKDGDLSFKKFKHISLTNYSKMRVDLQQHK